ncbi:MAG: peptidoglycan-binding domain-containing protein, partial [Thermodesulfobacteriota bacterium]
PRPDPAIRQVQGLLHEHGYDPGRIDGILGPQTRSALRHFQRDRLLPETGTVDAATKEALLEPATY